MQKISVGFLIEVQLSVHFTYKYMNAIITNNTIQHTKETLWKTIIRATLHFFVEFMICVRSLCQTLLFSEV